MPLIVSDPAYGEIGKLYTLDLKSDDILIFQLPRETRMLSETYVGMAQEALAKSLPPGTTAVIMGCDVDVYALAGEDAVSLKLKGII